MIGVEFRDYSPDRIVKQHGAYARCSGEFESVRRAEERFVLANGFPFVIEDGPAAPDPTWIDVRSVRRQRPRLGLNLLLDLAPEAVRIGEAMLYSRLFVGAEVGVVGFARQGIDRRRLRL